MKISRIEHLGIAVQSIDAVLPYFRDVLGLEVYKTEVVEDQKVKTAFLKVGEVKPAGMESKKVSGLFFAGEILDVDAYTGGFNLQIAWSTGRAAGLAAAETEGEREA